MTNIDQFQKRNPTQEELDRIYAQQVAADALPTQLGGWPMPEPEHVHGPWIPLVWEYQAKLGKPMKSVVDGWSVPTFDDDGEWDAVSQSEARRKVLTKVACSSCLEQQGVAR